MSDRTLVQYTVTSAAPILSLHDPAAEPEHFAPPVPATVEDTGISQSVVEALLLKFLFFRGDMLGRDLANSLGLKFSVIEHLIDTLKRMHLIQAKRSFGMGDASAVFTLADAGRALARDYIEKDQYVGPLPVPLSQYAALVRLQRPPDGWLTKDSLQHAYRKMVITPRMLSQIGPAVSSGNSLLIYGQPGNGKTYLAEALQGLANSDIYIPNAVECQGNIIQVYDPVYHHRIADREDLSALTANEPTYDGRWLKCKRPFIVTGGELTLDMLDLSYNATARIYDAPFQVKANNGIYLIDDFGRQRVSPAEVLNRWIVPMERRVDYLSFKSGGKMTVPFDSFLIFSTNLKPDQLGDEAFLRRIQYKMLVRCPEANEFLEIFIRFCAAKEIPCPAGLPERFLEKHYRGTGKPFRRCQPRDVISHAIDLIHFEQLPMELNDELMDRAFESCFAEETE